MKMKMPHASKAALSAPRPASNTNALARAMQTAQMPAPMAAAAQTLPQISQPRPAKIMPPAPAKIKAGRAPRGFNY